MSDYRRVICDSRSDPLVGWVVYVAILLCAGLALFGVLRVIGWLAAWLLGVR
jgi:hypothetical protein